MARADFISQLREMGYVVEERGENRLAFPYTVTVGPFAGKDILLGFAVNDDFPLNPPSGPHLSPRLLPIHPGSDIPHPKGGVHESADFGPDWEYWSRPFHGWAKTDRTVAAYMAHVRNLLMQEPY